MIATLKRWFGILPPGAIELKRGSVYVIESSIELNPDSVADIYAFLDPFTEETGCKFLLLDRGLKIAVRK